MDEGESVADGEEGAAMKGGGEGKDVACGSGREFWTRLRCWRELRGRVMCRVASRMCFKCLTVGL